MSNFVTVRAEIRAPRAQVEGIASRAARATEWLHAPAQVARETARRELPDGTVQVVVEGGDKLRDKVVSVEGGTVVVESELRPRKSDVPGRKLRYELSLSPGPATTIAELSLAFLHTDAAPQGVEVRRWKRHAQQCLQRLTGLAEIDGAE